MERFAIKIDENIRSNLYRICRLCGIDNPNKQAILEETASTNADSKSCDVEPELSRKIFDCVGIQVTKNDRMPQFLCSLCFDKINDFYEFREMCLSTNLQTRKLLGLPDMPDLPKIEQVPSETILGLDPGAGCSEESKETPSKKRKKTNAHTVSSPQGAPLKKPKIVNTENLVQKTKKVVKDEDKEQKINKPIGKNMKVESKDKKSAKRTHKELENKVQLRSRVDSPVSNTLAKTKSETSVKKKVIEEKDKVKEKVDEVLGGKKSVTKLKDLKTSVSEKKPEKINQKEDLAAKKRKLLAKKRAFILPDKGSRAGLRSKQQLQDTSFTEEKDLISLVQESFCNICQKGFPNYETFESHLRSDHVPSIIPYYCIYCNEIIINRMDIKNHNLWHKLSKTPYKCGRCDKIVETLTGYTKHIHECSSFEQTNIFTAKHCAQCNNEFETQNLYDWHDCVINSRVCPKCKRKLPKKFDMKKHIIRCSGTVKKNDKESHIYDEVVPQLSQKEFPRPIKEEQDDLLQPSEQNCPEIDLVVNENNASRNNKSQKSIQQNMQQIDDLLKSNFMTMVNVKQEPIEDNLSESEIPISEIRNRLVAPVTPENRIKEEVLNPQYDDVDFRNHDAIDKQSVSSVVPKPKIKLKIKKELGTLHSSFVGESSCLSTPTKKKKKKKRKVQKTYQNLEGQSEGNQDGDFAYKSSDQCSLNDSSDNWFSSLFADYHDDYSSDGSGRASLETPLNTSDNSSILKERTVTHGPSVTVPSIASETNSHRLANDVPISENTTKDTATNICEMNSSSNIHAETATSVKKTSNNEELLKSPLVENCGNKEESFTMVNQFPIIATVSSGVNTDDVSETTPSEPLVCNADYSSIVASADNVSVKQDDNILAETSSPIPVIASVIGGISNVDNNLSKLSDEGLPISIKQEYEDELDENQSQVEFDVSAEVEPYNEAENLLKGVKIKEECTYLLNETNEELENNSLSNTDNVESEKYFEEIKEETRIEFDSINMDNVLDNSRGIVPTNYISSVIKQETQTAEHVETEVETLSKEFANNENASVSSLMDNKSMFSGEYSKTCESNLMVPANMSQYLVPVIANVLGGVVKSDIDTSTSGNHFSGIKIKLESEVCHDKLNNGNQGNDLVDVNSNCETSCLATFENSSENNKFQIPSIASVIGGDDHFPERKMKLESEICHDNLRKNDRENDLIGANANGETNSFVALENSAENNEFQIPSIASVMGREVHYSEIKIKLENEVFNDKLNENNQENDLAGVNSNCETSSFAASPENNRLQMPSAMSVRGGDDHCPEIRIKLESEICHDELNKNNRENEMIDANRRDETDSFVALEDSSLSSKFQTPSIVNVMGGEHYSEFEIKLESEVSHDTLDKNNDVADESRNCETNTLAAQENTSENDKFQTPSIASVMGGDHYSEIRIKLESEVCHDELDKNNAENDLVNVSRNRETSSFGALENTFENYNFQIPSITSVMGGVVKKEYVGCEIEPVNIKNELTNKDFCIKDVSTSFLENEEHLSNDEHLLDHVKSEIRTNIDNGNLPADHITVPLISEVFAGYVHIKGRSNRSADNISPKMENQSDLCTISKLGHSNLASVQSVFDEEKSRAEITESNQFGLPLIANVTGGFIKTDNSGETAVTENFVLNQHKNVSQDISAACTPSENMPRKFENEYYIPQDMDIQYGNETEDNFGRDWTESKDTLKRNLRSPDSNSESELESFTFKKIKLTFPQDSNKVVGNNTICKEEIDANFEELDTVDSRVLHKQAFESNTNIEDIYSESKIEDLELTTELGNTVSKESQDLHKVTETCSSKENDEQIPALELTNFTDNTNRIEDTIVEMSNNVVKEENVYQNYFNNQSKEDTNSVSSDKLVRYMELNVTINEMSQNTHSNLDIFPGIQVQNNIQSQENKNTLCGTECGCGEDQMQFKFEEYSVDDLKNRSYSPSERLNTTEAYSNEYEDGHIDNNATTSTNIDEGDVLNNATQNHSEVLTHSMIAPENESDIKGKIVHDHNEILAHSLKIPSEAESDITDKIIINEHSIDTLSESENDRTDKIIHEQKEVLPHSPNIVSEIECNISGKMTQDPTEVLTHLAKTTPEAENDIMDKIINNENEFLPHAVNTLSESECDMMSEITDERKEILVHPVNILSEIESGAMDKAMYRERGVTVHSVNIVSKIETDITSKTLPETESDIMDNIFINENEDLAPSVNSLSENEIAKADKIMLSENQDLKNSIKILSEIETDIVAIHEESQIPKHSVKTLETESDKAGRVIKNKSDILTQLVDALPEDDMTDISPNNQNEVLVHSINTLPDIESDITDKIIQDQEEALAHSAKCSPENEMHITNKIMHNESKDLAYLINTVSEIESNIVDKIMHKDNQIPTHSDNAPSGNDITDERVHYQNDVPTQVANILPRNACNMTGKILDNKKEVLAYSGGLMDEIIHDQGKVLTHLINALPKIESEIAGRVSDNENEILTDSVNTENVLTNKVTADEKGLLVHSVNSLSKNEADMTDNISHSEDVLVKHSINTLSEIGSYITGRIAPDQDVIETHLGNTLIEPENDIIAEPLLNRDHNKGTTHSVNTSSETVDDITDKVRKNEVDMDTTNHSENELLECSNNFLSEIESDITGRIVLDQNVAVTHPSNTLTEQYHNKGITHSVNILSETEDGVTNEVIVDEKEVLVHSLNSLYKNEADITNKINQSENKFLEHSINTLSEMESDITDRIVHDQNVIETQSDITARQLLDQDYNQGQTYSVDTTEDDITSKATINEKEVLVHSVNNLSKNEADATDNINRSETEFLEQSINTLNGQNVIVKHSGNTLTEPKSDKTARQMLDQDHNKGLTHSVNTPSESGCDTTDKTLYNESEILRHSVNTLPETKNGDKIQHDKEDIITHSVNIHPETDIASEICNNENEVLTHLVDTLPETEIDITHDQKEPEGDISGRSIHNQGEVLRYSGNTLSEIEADITGRIIHNRNKVLACSVKCLPDAEIGDAIPHDENNGVTHSVNTFHETVHVFKHIETETFKATESSTEQVENIELLLSKAEQGVDDDNTPTSDIENEEYLGYEIWKSWKMTRDIEGGDIAQSIEDLTTPNNAEISGLSANSQENNGLDDICQMFTNLCISTGQTGTQPLEPNPIGDESIRTVVETNVLCKFSTKSEREHTNSVTSADGKYVVEGSSSNNPEAVQNKLDYAHIDYSINLGPEEQKPVEIELHAPLDMQAQVNISEDTVSDIHLDLSSPRSKESGVFETICPSMNECKALKALGNKNNSECEKKGEYFIESGCDTATSEQKAQYPLPAVCKNRESAESTSLGEISLECLNVELSYLNHSLRSFSPSVNEIAENNNNANLEKLHNFTNLQEDSLDSNIDLFGRNNEEEESPPIEVGTSESLEKSKNTCAENLRPSSSPAGD